MAEPSSTDPTSPADTPPYPARPLERGAVRLVGQEVPPLSEEPSLTAAGFTLQNADRRHTYTVLALARLRERAGDYAGAEELYRQAADRGTTDALRDLANLRERAGDHAGAQALAETMLRARRTPPEGGLRRALFITNRGHANLRPSGAKRRRTFRGIVVSVVAMIVLIGLGGLLRPMNSTKKDSATSLAAAASPTPTTKKDSAASSRPRQPLPPTMPSPTATPRCQDNISRFLRAVQNIDPDGDELRGLNDAALVQLGHASLTNPSVLREIQLVPFQYPRFISAANQWLCH